MEEQLALRLTSEDGVSVHRVVGRLSKSMWSDAKGVYMKISMVWHKRRTDKPNIVALDIDQGGAETFWTDLKNSLDSLKPGVYSVLAKYDTDSDGECYGVSYELVPYERG
jgi:hypothetical protein